MQIKITDGCKWLFVLCSTSLAAFFGYAAQVQSSQWIGDGEPEREEAAWYDEDPAGEFQSTFVAPKGAKTAKIDFAAAGFAVLEVNGKALTDESGLDTLWSVYGKTVYSRKFEIPVKEGKNIVTVRLGNGFWNILPLRFWGKRCFRAKLAHGRPCFKMDIDGLAEPLVWKWRKTNVIRNSVYLGTEIDATRKNGEWRDASFVKGPAGRIIEWPAALKGTYCVGESVGKHSSTFKGRQILDFGTNMTGVPEFVFRNEKRGTRIEIVYGERLRDNGTVNVLTQTAGQVKKNRCSGGPGAPETACQRDVYICLGAAEERFSPPFTWHIYRYAEVRGAKNALKAGDAKRRDMSMLSAPKKIKTGNAQLDTLHDVCVRTFQANVLGGIQSDCPGRERLGYGGDIVSTCDAYCLNWDMCEIYLKILRDFADEAQDNGWITETAPYVGIADSGFGRGLRAGPLSWALAVPVLIDALIRYYDDERGLAFYPVCARYLRLVNAKCPSGITAACLGDHEAIKRPNRGMTATAHWYEFARLTASFAKRLGNKADAAEFESMAAKVKKAFADKFVKNGVVDDGSQSAQSTALYLGLVPAAQRDAAIAHLIADLKKGDYAPTTGIFGTRYMLLFLSANGHIDIARRIVLRKDFPGFMHMINRGATTLWETWKESTNTYSNCHPMFGSVDEWILRYGIESEAATVMKPRAFVYQYDGMNETNRVEVKTITSSGANKTLVWTADSDRAQCGVGFEFTATGWSVDNYVFAPAALYNGNRFDIAYIKYAPYIFNWEMPKKKDRPVVTTNIHHLNKDGTDARIDFLAGETSAPMVGYWDSVKKEGHLFLADPNTPLGETGFSVRESPRNGTCTFVISAPGIRTTKYTMCRSRREDCGDRAPTITKGTKVNFGVTVLDFKAKDITAFLAKALEVRKLRTGRTVHAKVEDPETVIQQILANQDAVHWYEDKKKEIGYYCNNPNGNSPFGHLQLGWNGVPINLLPILEHPTPERLRRCALSWDAIATMNGKSGIYYAINRRGEMIGDAFGRMTKLRDHAMIRRTAITIYYGIQSLQKMESLGVAIKPEWKESVRKACDGVVALWKRYGQLGQYIKVDSGEIHAPNSTNGALIPGALALASKYFNNAVFMDVAKATGRYLFDHDLSKGYSGGGPAEILQAPDSESSCELGESYIALWELTGEKEWIEMAKAAAAMYGSWVVAYDYSFPKTSRMYKLGIKTTGSVWASVQNRHSAPGPYVMSADWLIKLSRATNDGRYAELFYDNALNIAQYATTRKNQFMPKGDPGTLTERVNTCDWEGRNRVGSIMARDSNHAWENVALFTLMALQKNTLFRPETNNTKETTK